MDLGIYTLKDFCRQLKIADNQRERRREELYEWLTNFFNYEILDGKPIRIEIKEIYGEYQQLPRKLPSQNKLNKEKEIDYTNYTLAALGTDFKPNSQSKIARDAINDFGYDKYKHTNAEAVVKRFIKEPFNKYGENDGTRIWVYFSNYEPIKDKELERWRQIREEENILEKEAANAFYRQEQGEDITKEKNSFKRAMDRFKEECGDIPVLVGRWKLKSKN